MSNIGIFHYKVGGTDGVSLEINKWKKILEELGHKVFLCAGDLGGAQGTLIREMYHHTSEAERLNLNTFKSLSDFPDNAEYASALEDLSIQIEKKLDKFIEENKITLLLPNNIWSVGANPAAAVALTRSLRKYGLPALAHHHDFYYERLDGLALTCQAAVEVADKYLPPRDAKIKHVVINKIAQQELMERKGIASTIVPNVFDFDGNSWNLDDYNKDFLDQIGLRKNDIVILQAARLVPRKGIELAIDLVSALNKPKRRTKLKEHGLYDGRVFKDESRIVLVLAGYAQDDLTGRYVDTLKEKIRRTGVDALFIEDKIRGSRSFEGMKKKYSLWDSYVFADLVIYSSLWEGWGNQLLEAVYARLPTVIFEYPVYLSDIKNKKFHFISLGSQISGKDDLGLAYLDKQIIETTADRIVEYLIDNNLRKVDTEYNYIIGQEFYSYTSLHRYLEELI
ncbi:MAG: glycosyltransferase family 4 protein [Pelolinea sp.]|nr:glycosyltransferase family 4 protein [Pelolinea sp.]